MDLLRLGDSISVLECCDIDLLDFLLRVFIAVVLSLEVQNLPPHKVLLHLEEVLVHLELEEVSDSAECLILGWLVFLRLLSWHK